MFEGFDQKRMAGQGATLNVLTGGPATSDLPPVLMIHGEADPLVPVMALHASVPVLGASEVPVEWHVRPNLEHGIDVEGLELGAAFLKRVFA